MKHNLIHATTSQKAKAIQMVGFRIGPKTLCGTGYCKREDYDCLRATAYARSEAMLEETRKALRPDVPTRSGATFFYHQNGSPYMDDPGEMVTDHDDYGRPVYDFGFGKDTLFVVDRDKVPCKCGVGASQDGDEVFRFMLTDEEQKTGKQLRHWDVDVLKGDSKKLAAKFWKTAKVYDNERFNPYVKNRAGDMVYDYAEVWCPCPIPRSAITAKYDKFNPVPGSRD